MDQLWSSSARVTSTTPITSNLGAPYPLPAPGLLPRRFLYSGFELPWVREDKVVSKNKRHGGYDYQLPISGHSKRTLADACEAASKLVFGLLPKTEPGFGTGRCFAQFTSIRSSHTVRHAHPRVEFYSKVRSLRYSNKFERVLGIASPARTIRVGAAESDQGSLPRSPNHHHQTVKPLKQSDSL